MTDPNEYLTWRVIDLYVGKSGAPDESGFIPLKEPATLAMVTPMQARLTGLVPHHPQIPLHVRWCSELEGQICTLVPAKPNEPRPWVDLKHNPLRVRVRCHFATGEQSAPGSG